MREDEQQDVTIGAPPADAGDDSTPEPENDEGEDKGE
jgi:hypothetical protein